MTMRVAVVNPVWDERAGAPEDVLRQFHSLTGWAEAVAAAGAVVTVHQRFRSPAALEYRGVPYAFVSDGAGPGPVMWHGAREISASVEAVEPHVVHVNGVLFPQWVRALRRALPPAIRMVVQDHGGWHPRGASLWSRARVRRGLMAADALLVSSPGHVAAWEASGASPPGLRVLDVMEASTALRPMRQPEAATRSGMAGDPAVLWVGRLTPNKDPLTMLEGFSRFIERHPHAALSMVFNGGTLVEAVRARIEHDSRLKSRVRVVGAVAADDMAAYFSAADIFVSASHREGSGYAAIEAMACGAAPVLTDIPSFAALTNGGKVGALWQPGQAQELCAALSRTAAAPRASLRASVRERFTSALSWDVLGRRAVEIYREVRAR